MRELTSIAGQVAVIAGGTQGIGLACAERFVAEGAKVAVIGRDPVRGEAALAALRAQGAGEGALFLAADCTVGAEVDRAIAAVREALGAIDILVNGAGGFHASPRIDAIDEDGWRRGIDLNLTSKFLLARALAPQMKERGYGRIVNISSIAGRTGIAAAPLDYSAGKAGVEGLTRRLAAELAPHGVTVNAVAPGTTLSPRVARLSERRLEEVRKNIPVGRLASPAEIAHGIWYLCTPGAGFVTGAVLDMNGGVFIG